MHVCVYTINNIPTHIYIYIGYILYMFKEHLLINLIKLHCLYAKYNFLVLFDFGLN